MIETTRLTYEEQLLMWNIILVCVSEKNTFQTINYCMTGHTQTSMGPNSTIKSLA